MEVKVLNKFKQMLGIKQYPGMPLIPELTKQARVNIDEMSRLLDNMYSRVASLEDIRQPNYRELNELYSLKSEIILLRHTLDVYAYDEAMRIVSRPLAIEKPTTPSLEKPDNSATSLADAAEIGELGTLGYTPGLRQAEPEEQQIHKHKFGTSNKSAKKRTA